MTVPPAALRILPVIVSIIVLLSVPFRVDPTEQALRFKSGTIGFEIP